MPGRLSVGAGVCRVQVSRVTPVRSPVPERATAGAFGQLLPEPTGCDVGREALHLLDKIVDRLVASVTATVGIRLAQPPAGPDVHARKVGADDHNISPVAPSGMKPYRGQFPRTFHRLVNDLDIETASDVRDEVVGRRYQGAEARCIAHPAVRLIRWPVVAPLGSHRAMVGLRRQFLSTAT